MKRKLICVGGARPNFMKLAPLVAALEHDDALAPVLVHTGQHYDDKMSGRFFRDLGMRPPDHFMGVGSGTHAQQTAAIMQGFEPIVLQEQPAGVIVVGDVNSTIACALVAAKMGIPVVHVEAGLRSFDRGMPEEINRIVTDSVSDLLLVTEASGIQNLRAEGIPESRIRLIGNLMIDTLRRHLAEAEQSPVLAQLGIEDRPYGLVTLHRPANVDDPACLGEILGALEEIARTLPLYFPVHPRTRAAMRANATDATPGIHLIEPQGYLEFLRLMSCARIVLTDSGGVQEETTALGVACLTLRNNTERPITIEQGTNILAGTCKQSILAAWKQMNAEPKTGRIPPLWDGQAARRCVDALREFFVN